MDEITVSWDKITEALDKRIELMKPAIENELRKHISDDIIFSIGLMREGLEEDVRKIVKEQLKDLRRVTEPREFVVRPFNWDAPGEYEEEMFMKAEDAIIGWYEHPMRIKQISESDLPAMFKKSQIDQCILVGLDFRGKQGKVTRARFMEMLVERDGVKVEKMMYHSAKKNREIDYWAPVDREEWLEKAIMRLDSLAI